jgi:hypothetical protein
MDTARPVGCGANASPCSCFQWFAASGAGAGDDDVRALFTSLRTVRDSIAFIEFEEGACSIPAAAGSAGDAALDRRLFGGRGKISFGNSWGNEQTERTFGDSFAAPAAGFHVIGAEWTRSKITWTVDGKDQLESVDGVPGVPMFLMIEGPMDVDYIRVAASKLN